MKPGPRNLITDVEGLLVGNSEDHEAKTGTTVLTSGKAFVCGVNVMGGSPGTRETDLLAADKVVECVDAIVLSGGSGFGLDAANGVADALAKRGRGYKVGPVRVPIVPGAILFDLINGGDKGWDVNPYRRLGVAALENAGTDFAIGTAGAGTGATTAGLKGGLGSASLDLGNGFMVGALAACNPIGQVVADGDGRFFAGWLEQGDEFGGLGPMRDRIDLEETAMTKGRLLARMMGQVQAAEFRNTTIAVVATNADLTNAQLTRMATAAQDGMARAIMPSHTPADGDLVFALSTGALPLASAVDDALAIGHAASVCLSRAIARAIYLATPAPGDLFPTWQRKYGTD